MAQPESQATINNPASNVEVAKALIGGLQLAGELIELETQVIKLSESADRSDCTDRTGDQHCQESAQRIAVRAGQSSSAQIPATGIATTGLMPAGRQIDDAAGL